MGKLFGKRALADVAELGDNDVAGPRVRRRKVHALLHSCPEASAAPSAQGSPHLCIAAHCNCVEHHPTHSHSLTGPPRHASTQEGPSPPAAAAQEVSLPGPRTSLRASAPLGTLLALSHNRPRACTIARSQSRPSCSCVSVLAVLVGQHPLSGRMPPTHSTPQLALCEYWTSSRSRPRLPPVPLALVPTRPHAPLTVRVILSVAWLSTVRHVSLSAFVRLRSMRSSMGGSGGAGGA